MTAYSTWDDSPAWSLMFNDADRAILGALTRLAGEGQFMAKPALAALLLAKAVRLNHVVLTLEPVALRTLLDEQLWTVRGAEGDFVTAPAAPSVEDVLDSVEALLTLGDWVATRQPLDEAVALRGSPIVVASSDGADRSVAFRRFAFAEDAVARRLLDAARSVTPLAGIDPATFVASLDRQRLSDEGARAIANVLRYPVSVVTGGPGRGKTSVVASMLAGLVEDGRQRARSYRVALCAPTAKAAVRMREAIDAELASRGLDADVVANVVEIDERSGSVHQLLAIRPDNMKSLRTLDHDVVVVDEVSMLELTLLAKLLEHARASHVMLVGDADQLASVNVGAALRDIVDAAADTEVAALVTTLTTNYRFRGEIDDLARAINRGDADEVRALCERHPDVTRRRHGCAEVLGEVLDWARELRDEAREPGESIPAALRAMSVLCATRQGEGSVGWWRETLERRLAVDEIDSARRFRLGTPVLVTQNEPSSAKDPRARLSNGDVGIVRRDETGEPVVLFGPSEPIRRRRPRELHRAEPAWSMTIHKSQGSEYERVIVSLPHASSRILTRELLYTAVTRAKNVVTIVGSDAALEAALARRTQRASGLVDRLRALVASGA